MWFAVLLALVIPVAALAAEPSASELLERTKAGKSVVSDSSGRGVPELALSLGAGMYAVGSRGDVIFGELSVYFDGSQGVYAGYGVLNDDIVGDWRVIQGGWNMVLDRHARMGLGFEHHSITIDAPGFISFEEKRTGPHAWLELGLRRGPAVRLEYSKLGVVGAIHIRVE